MVECLEQRSLLSAAPAPVNLIGTFTGTIHLHELHAKLTGSPIRALTLSVTGQASNGALSGSLTVAGLGNFSVSGTLVNRKFQLDLEGDGTGTMSGHVSARGEILTGHATEQMSGSTFTGNFRIQPPSTGAALGRKETTSGSTSGVASTLIAPVSASTSSTSSTSLFTESGTTVTTSSLGTNNGLNNPTDQSAFGGTVANGNPGLGTVLYSPGADPGATVNAPPVTGGTTGAGIPSTTPSTNGTTTGPTVTSPAAGSIITSPPVTTTVISPPVISTITSPPIGSF